MPENKTEAAEMPEKPEAASPKEIHMGHRQRLRTRFRREGLEHFEPHEVLELLLYYCHARRDMNPVAHALLDTFGSLKGVLEASPEQLMTVNGVGEEAAALLSLMVPLFRRYTLELAQERPRIDSTDAAKAYALALLEGQRTERFYVICLGANRSVLGRQLIAEGTVTEVAAYPRQVAETALNLAAQGVVLCHNHPGGTCAPSPEDIASTKQLQQLLRGVGILVLDHIIVANENTYSMIQHGDIDYRTKSRI